MPTNGSESVTYPTIGYGVTGGTATVAPAAGDYNDPAGTAQSDTLVTGNATVTGTATIANVAATALTATTLTATTANVSNAVITGGTITGGLAWAATYNENLPASGTTTRNDWQSVITIPTGAPTGVWRPL